MKIILSWYQEESYLETKWFNVVMKQLKMFLTHVFFTQTFKKLGLKKGRRVGQRIICNSSAKEVLECSALRPRNGLCELELRGGAPVVSSDHVCWTILLMPFNGKQTIELILRWLLWHQCCWFGPILLSHLLTVRQLVKSDFITSSKLYGNRDLQQLYSRGKMPF